MRHLIITTLLLLCGANLWAQHLVPLPNIQSPNAASFAIHGNIPVSGFSGVPDISLPLLTITEGDLSLPVTLAYHSASVQVNNHPGWVGHGFTLQCGGVINRIQRGLMDEQQGVWPGQKYGYLYNYSELNTADWDSPEKLKQFARYLIDPIPKELMADEFQFNFMGYSGKFMLNHLGKWVVVSRDKIKVIVHDLVTTDELREVIRMKMTANPRQYCHYYFNKFTLITPDGTKYTFGGIDATEYSVGYRNQAYENVIPTSWHLTEIQGVKGHTIKLQYTPKDFIAALSQGYMFMKHHSGSTRWLDGSCTGVASNLSLDDSRPEGYLIFPVYLSKIITTHATVDFSISETTELRYADSDLAADEDYFYDQFVYMTNPATEIKWYKLDKINVQDNNNNNEVIKSFDFSYTNSPDTRLKLNSVTESGKENSTGRTHSFQYYMGKRLPPYCTNKVDHYGFYNGYSTGSFNPSTLEEWAHLYSTQVRKPDATGIFVTAELLYKWVYPGQGYSIFEYEPHTYSSVVSEDRTTLDHKAADDFAGGSRIKKITSFDRDETKLLSKEYFYVKNYTGQSNISSLRSSGILGGYSKYHWPNYKGRDIQNNEFTYDLISSNSLFPYGYNAQGSHIGYSEVVEKVSGNGYTKYFFSNFDADIFGVTHMDTTAIAHVDYERSVYSPYISKALERGHPVLIENYDESNNKVSSTKIQYEKSEDPYNDPEFFYLRTVDLLHFDVCSGVTASKQAFYGTAYRTCAYYFNKVKEETTVYSSDKSGLANTSTATYHYNEHNLVDETISASSDGKEEKISVVYSGMMEGRVKPALPVDPETKALSIMGQNLHILNYPVATTIFHNDKAIRSTAKTYLYQNGKVNVYKEYEAEFLTPVLNFTSVSVSGGGNGSTDKINLNSAFKLRNTYSYNDYGNIKDVVAYNGITTSYIWGYKNHFPVAKVENASYDEIKNVLTQQTIDQLNTGYPTDEQVRTKLMPLRTHSALQKAQVATYTFAPLTGITSKTDTNNNTEYYEYDKLGRLTLIRDFNMHILKEFKYQYAQ
jgi:YD repeat-containing protein